MIQNRLTRERSKISVVAFVSAIIFLVYGIIMAAIIIFVIAIGGLECSRQDFSACALQNLFTGLLELIFWLIFIFAIPACFILVNGILTVAGLMQKESKKDLIVASLVLNISAVIVPPLLISAFLTISGQGN